MLAPRLAAALAVTAVFVVGCRKHPEPPHVIAPGEKGPCCPVADPTTWDPPPTYYTHDEPVFRETGDGLVVACKVGMRFRLTDEGCFKCVIPLVEQWRDEHEHLSRADLELRFAAAQPIDGVQPGDLLGRVTWRARDEALGAIPGETLHDARGYSFLPPGVPSDGSESGVPSA